MPDFSLHLILSKTGFLNLTFGNIVMIVAGLLFIYLAIVEKMEPYELLPIGCGIILTNLPLTRMMAFSDEVQGSGLLGIFFHYGLSKPVGYVVKPANTIVFKYYVSHGVGGTRIEIGDIIVQMARCDEYLLPAVMVEVDKINHPGKKR